MVPTKFHQRVSTNLSIGMDGRERAYVSIFSRIARVAGAAVVLALMVTLVWAFSLSWYLPASGAAAGAAVGWAGLQTGPGGADAALTWAVRGAALGLAVVFLYNSGCTSGSQEPADRETLVWQPSEDPGLGLRVIQRGGERAIVVGEE